MQQSQASRFPWANGTISFKYFPKLLLRLTVILSNLLQSRHSAISVSSWKINLFPLISSAWFFKAPFRTWTNPNWKLAESQWRLCCEWSLRLKFASRTTLNGTTLWMASWKLSASKIKKPQRLHSRCWQKCRNLATWKSAATSKKLAWSQSRQCKGRTSPALNKSSSSGL